MSASDSPSASSGDDLAKARADAEKRYTATRHSSESEDLSTSEDERARKSKRLRKKTRRAERDAIWELPDQEGYLWLASQQFRLLKRKQYGIEGIHCIPTLRAIAEEWRQLPLPEREPFEKLALACRSDYLTSMAKYNARIPLSPSLGSKSTSSQSSDSECGTLDSDYESDDTRSFRDYEQGRRRACQCWNRYRRDHPRACGIASEPVPPVPFPFTMLPPELRNRILQLLLGREKIVKQNLGIEQFDFSVQPIDTGLFAVSTTMRDEAEAVFYCSNQFQVLIHGCRELPPFILNPRPSIGAIRFMQVSIDLGSDFEDTDFIDCQRRFESLCQTLKQCPNLRELRFTYTGQFLYRNGHEVNNHGNFHAEFDRIMASFASLRGITKVVFELPRREDRYHPESVEEDAQIRPPGTEKQRARLKAIMESPQ